MVPKDRSLDGYARMFALTPQDLPGRILGCGAGPANSDAEATAAGPRKTSCNPPRDLFAGRDVELPERLGGIRPAANNYFVTDFYPGLEEGCYRDEVPLNLLFGNGAFGPALP